MFDSEGKQAFRRVIASVVGGGQLLDLGGDGDQLDAYADIALTLVEHDAVRAARLSESGLHVVRGDALSIHDEFDYTHADMCGPITSKNSIKVIQHFARLSRHGLFVTVNPDRERTDELQRVVGMWGVPATLRGIVSVGDTRHSRLSLRYITTYVRNEYNQWMWSAFFRRENLRGSSPDIAAVADALGHYGYWASDQMLQDHRGLFPHQHHLNSKAQRTLTRASGRTAYTFVCAICGQAKTVPSRTGRPCYCSEACRLEGRRRTARLHAQRDRAGVVIRERTCRVCGGEFAHPRKVGAPPRYCSISCRDEARKNTKATWYQRRTRHSSAYQAVVAP